MDNLPVTLGVAATIGAVTLLVLQWGSRLRRAPFPFYGYAGIAIIFVAELMLVQGVGFVTVYMTPLAWTGYLLAVDAAVFALRGRSRLRTEPGAFARLAAWSVPLWLLFEAYNLHLKNWTYVGMPEALWEQVVGSAWAYATIFPALFESADLVEALGWFDGFSARGWRFYFHGRRPLMVLGAAFLVVPVVLPARWASYLFALVWLGFTFLLEPINYARGHDSLLRDLEENRGQRLYALFFAGLEVRVRGRKGP
ncbi:MAG: hypothetical protein ACE5HB_06220, partial [Terriglobia bacterium]